MSKASRDGRRMSDPESRHAGPRKAKRTRGLRVIEGGRADSRSRAGDVGEAVGRRCEPSRKLKRRRRISITVMAVLAAGLITYVLLGPVTRLIESHQTLSQAEARLAEEKSLTQDLEDRKAWDLTERFVEWEARKMGYVKPGEIPIIVLDNQEEAASETDSNAPVP
jgi:hypothetical protein